MKRKILPRGKLVKKLDNVFSRYIRLKYRVKGCKFKCICYTCGEEANYKKLQNGHFITRANYKYRWSEDNCRPQCYKCNIIHSGNYKVYTLKMIGEYGQDSINNMINDKELGKISTATILEKIEYYDNLVKEMLIKN